MGIFNEKQMYPNSRIHSISSQHRGRPRIKNNRLQRMETKSTTVPIHMQKTGNARGRSLCIPSNTPDDQIHVMETGHKSNSSKCSANKLGTQVPICLSTIQTNRENSQQNKIPPHLSDHCYTSVANCHLVPNTSPNGYKKPIDAPTEPNTTNRTNGGTSSTTENGKTKASGLASLRTRLENLGISEKFTDLLLKARTRGTTRNCESAWLQLTSWCGQREKDPVQCELSLILEYLTHLWEQGKEYRTINNHRSSISLYHNNIEGIKVGQHPLVTQLLKGISKDRPPQPKLNTVWDIEIVLNYFKQLPQNTNNTIQSLTLKTATLLALVTIARASELHKLNIKWMVVKEEYITFQLEGIVKHSRQGKENPPIIIHKFSGDKNLCPVQF